MIAKSQVDSQLADIGAVAKFLGRPELRELPNILFAGEVIRHLTIGRYEGGWATLCATDRRVLLIDKKPFYLTLEDIRYDMVSDVQYNHRLIDATVRLGTVHKTIGFLGYNHEKLRALTNYVQEQVLYVRSQPGQASEPNQAPVATSTMQSNQAILGVEQTLRLAEAPKQLPINPYRAPVIVRKRVSRFY